VSASAAFYANSIVLVICALVLALFLHLPESMAEEQRPIEVPG
jgi:hypothetical protein